MKIPQTKKYSIYKNLVLQDERKNKINFRIDGRVYYVYRITEITSNTHYYGYRIKIKNSIIEDLKSYGSSSKKKKSIIKNPLNYRFKIIKTFNSAGEAIIYESFLHQYFNVKLHNSFWNESNQTPFGRDTSGKVYINGEAINKEDFNPIKHIFSTKNKVSCKDINTGEYFQVTKEDFDKNPKLVGVNYGVKMSDIMKTRLSKTMKGRIFSDKHLENLKIANSNKDFSKIYTKEYRKKLCDIRQKVINREDYFCSYAGEYKIFDENNILQHHIKGVGFIKYCDINNLPSSPFIKSYKSNSKVIIDPRNKKFYKKYSDFDNWLVLKI